MRQLVPIAVLLLTLSAVASALRPSDAPFEADAWPGTGTSARAMWVDSSGRTLVLVERWGEAGERVELEAIAESGATAWRREIGSGWLSALAEGDGQLVLAIARESRGVTRSRLLGLQPDHGGLLWSLEVEGEISDLLVDAKGGLRARSLRGTAGGGEASEHLLAIHAGALRWERALD
jgi:hypothetical protein